MDRYISTVVNTCDVIKAKKHSKKNIQLSFDEWNVYHEWEQPEAMKARPWLVAPPLLEESYTLEDALVVGGMLITLLKHSDRVKIACMAQLVNVLAPIMTVNGGICWKQSTYYPFVQASRFGRGQALDLNIHSPTYEDREYGPVPYLEAVGIWNQENEYLTIFAVNRDTQSSLSIEADVRAFPEYKVDEYTTLTQRDLKAGNTPDHPDRIVPRNNGDARLEKGILRATLPGVSWNMIRLAAGSH
jgi:alpha-N-arabinofuranosidase